MTPRRWLADRLMSVACALIGWAEWLDPAPMLPGGGERMRAKFTAAIGQDAMKGRTNGSRH